MDKQTKIPSAYPEFKGGSVTVEAYLNNLYQYNPAGALRTVERFTKYYKWLEEGRKK